MILILFIFMFHVEHEYSSLKYTGLNTQNYSIYADVPRGTLNNDINATIPHIASKTTKG